MNLLGTQLKISPIIETRAKELEAVTKFARNCDRLFRKPSLISDKVMHAAMGIAGEIGELIDDFKKVWIYGASLDKDNIIKECGDLLFYISVMAQHSQIDFRTIFFTSIPVAQMPLTDAIDSNPLLAEMQIASGYLYDYAVTMSISGTQALVTNQVAELLMILTGGVFTILEWMECSPSRCMEANIEKLAKRYPEGYSDEAARERADTKLGIIPNVVTDPYVPDGVAVFSLENPGAIHEALLDIVGD